MQRSEENQRESECFRENSLTTKEDILLELRWLKIHYKNMAVTDKEHSAYFYKMLDVMLDRTVKRVKDTHFFRELEDWWCYGIEISSAGITIILQLYGDEEFDENGEFEPCFVEEEFELIHVESRMLTVDEYAKQYGVDQGTVRQWIRRGKIRSAEKHGSEWRIPELTEPNHRGYRFGQFKITGHIDNLPEEYVFINDCEYVNFSQCDEDKKKYRISFSGAEHEAILCTAKEREKIELVLIASPDAKYISDVFGVFG